jgi:hypothetical protein
MAAPTARPKRSNQSLILPHRRLGELDPLVSGAPLCRTSIRGAMCDLSHRIRLRAFHVRTIRLIE